ncbi:MAG: DUF998 domain-containing protein [Chloroflexi bacterium]|nr:DUF998 domain-containing protein [Chloroflexota bacterium]
MQTAIADPVDNLLRLNLLSLQSPGSNLQNASYALTPEGEQARSLLIPFLHLRRAMGVVGIALPFVLLLGNFVFGDMLNVFPNQHGLQSSISAYYYTGMRNVFVGAICAIAVFLFSYTGYQKDYRWARVAGAFAFLVALLPTTPNIPNPTLLQQWVGGAHLLSAAVMFSMLGAISLFSFTKPDWAKGKDAYGKGSHKVDRNRVYRTCGVLIWGFILLIFITGFLPDDSIIMRARPVFWFEFFALVAFGFSWITKGNMVLSDIQRPKSKLVRWLLRIKSPGTAVTI